jgi:hypothetical protein
LFFQKKVEFLIAVDTQPIYPFLNKMFENGTNLAGIEPATTRLKAARSAC